VPYAAQALRSTVRKYVEARARVEGDTQAAAAEAEVALGGEEGKVHARALEAEKQALVNEKNLQSTVYQKYTDEAERLDKIVQDTMDERRKMQALKVIAQVTKRRRLLSSQSWPSDISSKATAKGYTCHDMQEWYACAHEGIYFCICACLRVLFEPGRLLVKGF